jgi:hypothetical protein
LDIPLRPDDDHRLAVFRFLYMESMFANDMSPGSSSDARAFRDPDERLRLGAASPIDKLVQSEYPAN